MMPQDNEETTMATDPRLCCKFHPDRPAKFLAPQHVGGNVDVPAMWVPICADHLGHWYAEHDEEYAIPEDERLPIFHLDLLMEWEKVAEDVRERRGDYLWAIDMLRVAP